MSNEKKIEKKVPTQEENLLLLKKQMKKLQDVIENYLDNMNLESDDEED